MEIVCCFNRMGVALLLLLFIYGLIDAQVLKYPGDECSVELRDNNLCLRDTGCVRTGYHPNGDEKRQCMCSEGRVLDATLHCSDCIAGDANFDCGVNAVCQQLPEIGDNVHRCVCNSGYVRNITNNDGSCTACMTGVSGFDSLCDKGACVNGDCVCGVGYVMDPVNKTCVHCDEPWHPSIACNQTYPNTTCFKDKLVSDFTCMCPLGETFNQQRQCGQCQANTAECRVGWECLEGHDHKDQSIVENWCYETCDNEDSAACDPRATQKMCTVAKLDLGEDTNVCRCQGGYVQQDDGTCVSALQQLNCFTCNATSSCIFRQSPKDNYYQTCEIGEFCWTTGNRYFNFATNEFENITYRRECHSNPCKNPNDEFCTETPTCADTKYVFHVALLDCATTKFSFLLLQPLGPWHPAKRGWCWQS
ncbi:uncharacterized protein LOC142343978 [Convolutriloba macropyga]|uniref:uncharacterized protein LOC142343978 n=1 Tax=Convolutriloba macropyga TaxID=536237 RepID=UPI003F522329